MGLINSLLLNRRRFRRESVVQRRLPESCLAGRQNGRDHNNQEKNLEPFDYTQTQYFLRRSSYTQTMRYKRNTLYYSDYCPVYTVFTFEQPTYR